MSDFVVADGNSTLVATILQRDGNVKDLTGHTVQLKYRIGQTPYTAKNMTVRSPTSGGVVEYKFAPADLANEGVLYAELEITQTSSGLIVSNSDVQEFTVRGKVI